MNWNILTITFLLTALLFCQSKSSTTETSPTTTTITVVGSIPEQNDTIQDSNKTDAATTVSPPTTTVGPPTTTVSPPTTTGPHIPTSAVYVPSDSDIENGSTYDKDVTTQKDTVSTSPAFNDVSQDNKIISESPQGQVDTHLTADWFSQTIETTTAQSFDLTTKLVDRLLESSSTKGSTIRPSTGTTRHYTPSEYLYVDHKDAVGRSIHPGSTSEQSGVIIIGAVLAFFCVAILVAVGLVFRRRRQNEKQKVMMNFDLNRMDLRSLRHQPPNVVTVNFPFKPEADLWQEVKPMNSSVI